MMGSSKNEEQRCDNEGPQHNVTVSPFFMGKYPVTQGQWRAIASQTNLKVKLLSYLVPETKSCTCRSATLSTVKDKYKPYNTAISLSDKARA